MGKKNKKLKKKKLSQPIIQPATISQSSDESIISSSATVQATPKLATNNTATAKFDEAEFVHVRGDVKRILLLLGLIIVVLFIIYYTDLKSHYLNSTADWLYKILNIQTQ